MSKRPITPEYLNLPDLAQYSGLGIRKLRDALKDRKHPLPHYRPGHRTIIVKLSDFDEWFKHCRVDRESELDRVVKLALVGVSK